MTPPHAKRRCWRADCPNWLELDPFNPQDAHRRYCSPACEHRDMLDIRAAASGGHTSHTLDESIAAALSNLRKAVAQPGLLSIALETRAVSRHRTRFLWVDCIARWRGDLVTVADTHNEALMHALLDELNEWRSHARRGRSGGRLDLETHSGPLAFTARAGR